jgi:hypothetical protein
MHVRPRPSVPLVVGLVLTDKRQSDASGLPSIKTNGRCGAPESSKKDAVGMPSNARAPKATHTMGSRIARNVAPAGVQPAIQYWTTKA